MQHIQYGYYGETKEIINMKKYKKISIIVLCVCLLLGTGCINEDTEGNKIGDEILRCLNEDDTEGLKVMFCAEIQISKDLDNQIQDGMDFFEGEVTDSNEANVDGGESVRDGETVEQHYRIHSYYLKTDKGKTYELKCYGYFINNEDPDKVGVSEIDIIQSIFMEI